MQTKQISGAPVGRRGVETTCGSSRRISVNVRTLGHFTTGVQRYVRALLPCMEDRMRTIAPRRSSQGVKGHLWEQFVLPGKLHGELLWSPGNTGPLSVHRQVLTLHDASTLDHPEWFEGKFARWYNWLLPRLARNVAGIITVSAHARERIIDCLGLDAAKVTAIPNGVDPQFVPVPAEAVAELRARFALPTPFFLYVGSLEPRKNLPLLLEAWSQVRSTDFQLVVAGTSSHVFRQSGLAAAENVRFLGRVEEADLPTLYSAAHAFVFPSIYEGFGLPPLEAMACGSPVLSADATSLPEVCGPAFDPVAQPNGAVLYFQPAHVESIVEGLRNMMSRSEMERQQMSDNARQRARLFSWETAAARTLELLDQIALQTQ